jgi:hypothetical protein
LISEQGAGFGFLNVSLVYVRAHNANHNFDYLHLIEAVRIISFDRLQERIKKIIRSLDENLNLRVLSRSEE